MKPLYDDLLPEAELICCRSRAAWPDRVPVTFIGQSPALQALLQKITKFANFSQPVLILGESGTGKELIARACYLLSERHQREFVPVSCPQYTEGSNTISELFGHKKGSFTGAVADRMGLFETADGGVIFLDEIADLPLQAQIMLLRTLAEGEFRRLGETSTRRANVRVLAATNKALKDLVVTKEFRHDLYFRLAYFPLQVPPLRERGRDWILIGRHFLRLLAQKHGVARELSPCSLALLDKFTWPGNIRQLEAVVTIGYSVADGALIEPQHFSHALDHEEFKPEASSATLSAAGVPATREEATGPVYDELYQRVLAPSGGFWKAIRTPFLERELNREQVRAIVERGLAECGGNYTELIRLFHISEDHYQKFMGFLRTHDLKIGVRGRRPGE